MLQRNSFFNYFNQILNLKKTKKTKIAKIIIKNAEVYVALPDERVWDNYNLQGTYVKNTKKIYKTVSENYFYNNFFIKWGRVVFKGKSYRIRNFKKNNKFTFNFGYSHWTRLKLFKNWQCFKRKRQNHVVFTYTLKDFLYFSRFLPYVRFMNCYTLRGLRLKKQFVIRRFGKISQHISKLH